MHEIIVSNKPKIDYDNCPLWYRLDPDSRYAINTAYRRVTGYKRRFEPPSRHPELDQFDAEKEMKRKPQYDREAMK